MPTEITAEGYGDLRVYVRDTWHYMELRDELEAVIHRFNIGAGERAIENGTVKFTQVVTGQDILDSPINGSLPTTVKHSALFKVATLGDEMDEYELTEFTFGEVGDECTFVHEVQVPQVGE